MDNLRFALRNLVNIGNCGVNECSMTMKCEKCGNDMKVSQVFLDNYWSCSHCDWANTENKETLDPTKIYLKIVKLYTLNPDGTYTLNLNLRRQ